MTIPADHPNLSLVKPNRPKFVEVDELAAMVRSDESFGVGGHHFARLPIALLRAIGKSGVKNLRYVSWAGGLPLELLAVVSLAGPCAEARLRGQRFDRMFLGVAATDDREAVAALGLSESQFLDACRETIELVEQDWKVIERVARELSRGGTLTYEEVEAIVIAEDGEG